VEALLKKLDDFEKSLAAQEEKIKLLDEFATKLIENEHYAADEVAARRDAVSVFFCRPLFIMYFAVHLHNMAQC